MSAPDQRRFMHAASAGSISRTRGSTPDRCERPPSPRGPVENRRLRVDITCSINRRKAAKGRAMRNLAARLSALGALCALAVGATLLCVPGALATEAGGTRVSVGSPPSPFSQNKQNEPALAVDAHDPNVLAAGANDNIDLEACNAGDPTTCPFTTGVGTSGVAFSLDGGATWIQPTYTGYTARTCLGPDPCASSAPPTPAGPGNAGIGPIGTLPGYVENGLVSNGDPALAFGPRPGSDGKFSWANGSRLYYANLAANFSAERTEQAFKGPFAVLVSRDGGSNWDSKQLTPAGTDPNSNNASGFGISGCTVRTDSTGTAYVFGERFAPPFSLPTHSQHVMFKSTDGGKSWTKATPFQDVVDPCFHIDPVIGRCVEDGIAGARNDLAASSSVDIANGAPTGADATNEIVDAWADGRDGINHEHVMVSYSTDGGAQWSTPSAIESSGDRGYYAAPALSPNGTDLYVVYNAYTTPYRDNTTDPRSLVGVLKHTDIGAGGAPGAWTELNRGAPGDPRGSSQNGLTAEFLGDYVYAAATRTYGAAVWNDVRNAADCPALDAWRMALRGGPAAPKPAPQSVCPATFGNSDIFGGSFPDPTP